MPFPTISADIPYITTEQMIEVDRLMIREYHIELVQTMENAGRGPSFGSQRAISK